PLPLRGTNGNFTTTYYFRQHIPLAVGNSNVTGFLRHVIDDGAIMYLNGLEFQRYNMPAGSQPYNTQANGNVGDAVYTPASGTINLTFTNLTGGDNVFAVEVHQNGSASSDVCFGAELSLSAPSIINPAPNAPAPDQLKVVRL